MQQLREERPTKKVVLKRTSIGVIKTTILYYFSCYMTRRAAKEVFKCSMNKYEYIL